jgi:hypothetical protein
VWGRFYAQFTKAVATLPVDVFSKLVAERAASKNANTAPALNSTPASTVTATTNGGSTAVAVTATSAGVVITELTQSPKK